MLSVSLSQLVRKVTLSARRLSHAWSPKKHQKPYMQLLRKVVTALIGISPWSFSRVCDSCGPSFVYLAQCGTGDVPGCEEYPLLFPLPQDSEQNWLSCPPAAHGALADCPAVPSQPWPAHV